MKLVLDACVGVSALLPEEHSEKSAALLLNYQNQVHELIAPDTFPAEVAHALTRAERKGFIKPPESVRLLGLLGDPERMGKALEAAKRSAEETRKQVGILNVCVDLIREVRDQ